MSDEKQGDVPEDEGARPAQRRVRIPGLDGLPESVLDHGRTARARVEAARAGVASARAGAMDVGRRLRAPGALLGPPRTAAGVPPAPEHALQRGLAEVGGLLPRSFELPAPSVKETVAPLGWTGSMYRIGNDTLALVRRVPPAQSSKLRLAVEIVAALVHDDDFGTEDRHEVELIGRDGHVLLRSTPRLAGRRERVARDVTLADGTRVATVVDDRDAPHRREVVPDAAVRAGHVLTDPRDLSPGLDGAARVWRGNDELASVRTQDREREVRVAGLASDDEALLVWAAMLSWWGSA